MISHSANLLLNIHTVLLAKNAMNFYSFEILKKNVFQLLDHFENIYSQILLFYDTTGIKKPLSDHPLSGHFRQV